MIICLERGADLHIAQLMTLPLTISCSSISRLFLSEWSYQNGSASLVLAYPGCPGKKAAKQM